MTIFVAIFLMLWLLADLVNTCWLNIFDFFFHWKLHCISFHMPCRMSSHDVLLWRKNSKHEAHFKTKLWIFHENPNEKKCTFSQLCQLWSTPVAHMLMIWTNRFWGLTSIHLKSFHLQYHGLKRNIHLGGSKKPFFLPYRSFLE